MKALADLGLTVLAVAVLLVLTLVAVEAWLRVGEARAVRRVQRSTSRRARAARLDVMPNENSTYQSPESAVSAYAHYIGQLIHWGAAEWRHVVHGGPDPGPVPTPSGSPAPGPTPPGPTPPPTSGRIFWVVDSTARSLVPDADLAAFVKASNDDVAKMQALWPHVQEWTHVGVAAGVTPTAAGYNPRQDILATLVATLPEAPDALAYHSVDNAGRPFIRVGVKLCLDNGVAWQSGADHETKETLVDPLCQAVAKAPNGDEWALEVADPVESASYQLDGVTLSDAVGPAFFGMGGGVLDQTGDATRAFHISPGGYAVINNTAVYGEKFPEFRRRHVESLRRMGTPRRPAHP